MADYQDISGLPATDELAQLELQRKLKMADLLRQSQTPQGQMVGNRFVAPSWTQYAADLANKYIGSKQEENAMKQYGEYNKSKQDKLSQAFDAYIKGKEPIAETQSTDNYVSKPYDIGANIPTSMFGTTEQLAQNSPSFNTQNMPEQMVNQPITSTTYRQPTRTEQLANITNFLKKSGNTDMLNKVVLGEAENLFKTPESVLGKVDVDKFDPQSVNNFIASGSKDYSLLKPIAKATSKYTNVQTDAAGVPYGVNTETNEYERIKGDVAAKTQWSEPYKVGNEYVQRNPVTGQVQKAYESGDKKTFTQTTELRNDFNNLPQVKSWNIVEPKLISAREAAKDTSGGSDLNMIYALGTVLDPNSVVREGELHLASDTGSLGQKIAGYYKSVNQGGKLTPEVKQDLLRQIESRTFAQRQQYEAAKKKYTEIAKKNDLDPNDLFIGTVVDPIDITKTPQNITPQTQSATHRFNPATGKIEVIKQ